jgi:hypothetical protein
MPSSGMLRLMALVRTDVSEALSSYETSVLARATWRNIPEDAILHVLCLADNESRGRLQAVVFLQLNLTDVTVN